MYERKMRNNPAPCYLLMPSERHLPGGKGDKDHTACPIDNVSYRTEIEIYH